MKKNQQQADTPLQKQFDDTLDQKDDILKRVLVKSAELIEATIDGVNYEKIADIIIEISGARYVGFNIFDEDSCDFTTVALAGLPDKVMKATTYLGFDVVNKKWKHDPVRAAKIKDDVITKFNSLHELTGSIISDSISSIIERTFHLGLVFVVQIIKNKKSLGDFTLIFTKGETLINNDLVALFANQIGVYIERLRTAEALEESKEKYRGLSEATFEAIFLSEKGKCIEQNLSAEKMFGYTTAEAIGRYGTEWIVPEDREMVMQNMMAGIETPYEATALRKDGSTFPCVLHGKMMFYKGRDVRVTSLRDISGQKKAEDLTKQVRKNYETFFNTIDEFLFVLDEQGNIIHMNSTVTERLGYTREELVGQTVLMVHPKERREEAGRIVGEMLSGLTEFCPVPLITKTGAQIPVETRVSSGTWDGRPAIFGVTKDISRVRLSEEKFSKVFFLNPSACGLSDLKHHKYVEVNEAFCSLLGYTKDEVIGKTAIELGILSTELMDAALQNADKNGNISSVEIDLTAKNGDIKHVILLAEIIQVQDNKFRFTVVHDMTERKLAEKNLRESQSKYFDLYTLMRLMSDTMPDMLWAKDLNNRFIFTNKAVCENLLGASDTSEPIGKDDIFFAQRKHSLNPNSPDWFTFGELCVNSDEITKKEMKQMQFDEYGNVNGNFLYLDVHKAPLYNEKNEFIGLVGSARDITARVAAEKDLRKSEQKLSTLFESMSEMVVLLELVYDEKCEPINYRMTDCNKAFTQILGFKREDVIGKLATEIYESEAAPFLQEYVRVINSGEPLEYTTFYAPLDKYFMVSVVSPRKNTLATITTDITEIKQNQEIIFDKNKELENYLYITTHDLRTPLVNIQGFSQKLEHQANTLKTMLSTCQIEELIKSNIDELSTESIPKTLNYILANVSKMDTLLNGLLKISRTGRMSLNIKKVNMNHLFKTIVYTQQFQITQHAAKINISDLHDCFGDEHLLSQLFSNIFSNALKYRDSSRQLVIDITSQTYHNKIIYSITDNGVGIAERNIEKIWDVFFRVNASSPEAGEGIGLSFAKRIVNKHKGKIWTESSEGKGSAFHVELNKNEFSE